VEIAAGLCGAEAQQRPGDDRALSRIARRDFRLERAAVGSDAGNASWFETRVSEQHSDSAQIGPDIELVSRESAPERVRCHALTRQRIDEVLPLEVSLINLAA
jgi:hypothetical protein